VQLTLFTSLRIVPCVHRSTLRPYGAIVAPLAVYITGSGLRCGSLSLSLTLSCGHSQVRSIVLSYVAFPHSLLRPLSGVCMLYKTFDVFVQFRALVEKQYGKPILCLHDDKGGEFIGNKWEAYMAEHGIRREHTVKATAQQNGVAERRNRTNEEHIIAMLNGAGLPSCFWGEALSYYNRVLNMSPSSAIPDKTTPYELVHGRKPDYSMLRVFGCRAWAHVGKKERKHLEKHAKPCVFLGLPNDFKCWKLWDPHAQHNRGGIIVSHHII
jgi:hypothetical protein